MRIGKFFLFFVAAASISLHLGAGLSNASEEEPAPRLSAGESEWLKAHPMVRIGIMPAWPPLNFVDRQGVPRGIGVDLINAMNKRLGDVLTVVPKPFKESAELVKNKELDGLMDITPKKEREPFYHFTAPYLTIPHVIVGRDQGPYFETERDLAGKVVALEKGFYNIKYFRKYFPEVVIKEYPSTGEALGAVSRGEADAYAGNRAVASYLMEQELMANLQIQGRLDKPPVVLTIGVRKDWPELASILDKTLGSMPNEEKSRILRNWISAWGAAEKPLTAQEPVSFDQTGFVLKSIAVVFALMLITVFILWIARGRPRQLSIRASLFGVLFVFAGLTVSIGTFVLLLLELEQKTKEIETLRDESIHLAYELKQSSDDLTRFARTFSVTGDSKYEAYFHDIVAIRDGLKPHPKNNTPSYWDHVAAGLVRLNQEGETYSIEQRMIGLELTEKEKGKLLSAKIESDDLINMESVAMKAVKGLYKNAAGEFSIKGAPDLAMARGIMHGAEYHQAKSRIMRHIDDFFALLEQRTANELNRVQGKTKAVLLAVTLLTIITVLFACASFFLLKRKIINPLYLLKSGAAVLEKGYYSHHIPIASNDEAGDLGKAFNAMAESIKERATRLRSIIDTAVDAILVVSSDGTVQEFSPAAEKMFGRKANEVIGKNVSILMPDYIGEHHNKYISRYFETGEKHVLGKIAESFGIRKNGEIFPVSISISEATINNERFFTGIIRDISERKEAERELQKLSSAVEQSPVSVIITDKDGKIEYVNSTFTKVTGYTFKEAIGQNPSLLKSGNLESKFYKDLWSTILSGKTWFGDLVNRTKQGREIWERTAIAPLLDDNGEVTHFVAVKEDITQQKEMERELQESEAQHRLLAESSADMIVQCDLDGRAEYLSPACLDLTGYEPAELLGRSMFEVVHPNDRDQIRKAVNKLMKTPTKTSFQARINRKQGGYRWVDSACRAILDQETKKIKGVLAVSRDITERMMLEEARRFSLKLNELTDSSSIDEILSQGLEESVRLTESRIGYLHMVDAAKQTVSLRTWSKETLERCAVKDHESRYPLEMAGIWADCARQKAPVVHNRYDECAGERGLPEGHIPIRRHMAVPAFEDEEVVAIIGVGDKSQPYVQYDIDILSMLAENIWSIVRRKKTADIIRRNEERLQLVLKGGDLGYWDTNLETRKTIVNDRWMNIFGYSGDEIDDVHSLWKERIHVDDKDMVLRTGKEYIIGDLPSYNIEYRIATKENCIKWVISRGAIVEWDNNGKPLRMVGTILDITGQKDIEHELRENMEELRKFTNIAIGREERMIELKSEVNHLLAGTGRDEKYMIR